MIHFLGKFEAIGVKFFKLCQPNKSQVLKKVMMDFLIIHIYIAL